MDAAHDTSGKENAGVADMLAVNQLKGARKAESISGSAGAMQKLAATFDNLQEQLQHLSRRDHGLALRDKNGHAAPQAPSSIHALAAPSAPAGQPAALASLSQAPASTMHAPSVAFAPAAAAAAAQGTTAMLLQQQVAPNDCILGHGGSKASNDSLFDFGSGTKDSQVHKLAEQLFEDKELLDLCDDGLNKQLQRTRDGATEQSRIQELAGLVKLLRKCVRELASRCSMYVDQCLKLEKDFMKQVEGIQLQSESMVKTLEAELAVAKKDLAQYEATFKMDKAKWGADLEDQKYEMMRLKRELDRVTEERDRARDSGKRAEQARQQLEVELKESKKQSTQQIREVASTQGEVVQKLMEAGEKRDALLKAAHEDRQRLAKRLEAAQSCIDALQGELSALQAVHEKTQEALRGRVAEDQLQQQHLTKLQAELEQSRQQLSEASTSNQGLEQELQATQAAREAAEEAARAEAQRAQELQLEVASVSATLQGERASWEEERRALTEAQKQAGERETALLDEKGLLKTAVTAAIAQKESLEAQLAALQKEHNALLNERSNLRNQVEFANGNQQAAEEQAAELQRGLDKLTAQMQALQEELQVKDARLQELEGEFGALKEVLGEFGQRDVVNNLLHKISTLQSAVAASNAIRRKLHNELVEVKGNIRVYCRIRPHSGTSCVRCLPDQSGLRIDVDGKEHSLEFDRVYGPMATQEEVFTGVSELVQSALDGYHVCLFSYGQTGAGKTYTMQGADSPVGRGIIPRAVEKILQTAAALGDQEWEYSMEASFIEIYNNQLRDLMGGPSAPYISDQNAIKHDASGGHTTVAGVSKVPVKDGATAAELVQRAAAARSCEATAMNTTSSRSHAIFMLYITGSHPPSGTQLQGCLCLVDLAGSERLDRSLAQGQRKAEACAINQSLSSIGDVFAALAAKSSHVPYRNSKLTYLLQPCLGGHGKTLMFVNINPEPASAYESLCSLKFATNVNGCETQARGGAKRNVVANTSAASSGSMASLASTSGGAEDDKRLSLPGFPRMSTIPEPATKRMSLMVPSRVGQPPMAPTAGGSAAGGKKRVAAPPAPSSGSAGVGMGQALPGSNPAKRVKPN